MSSGEPLDVVDGVPLRSGIPGHMLVGVNPADVARIDVLKDADPPPSKIPPRRTG